MTTVQVAQQTGMTRQAIAWNIRQGKLKATLLGDMWTIDPEDLRRWNIDRYNAKRKRNGRRRRRNGRNG